MIFDPIPHGLSSCEFIQFSSNVLVIYKERSNDSNIKCFFAQEKYSLRKETKSVRNFNIVMLEVFCYLKSNIAAHKAIC